MAKRKTIVEVADLELGVIVEDRKDGSVHYFVDDTEMDVEVLPLPDGGYSIRYGDGRMVRVDACEQGDHLDLYVKGVCYSVRAISERDTWLKSRGSTGGDDGRVLTVSMPGKVVKLLKVAGEAVSCGEGVMIIEAMKMENEVRAVAEGVVSEICVATGESVEADQPLARIEVGAGGDNV